MAPPHPSADDQRMKWDDRQRLEPELWWVDDPRWLGQPNPGEWNSLLADRLWLNLHVDQSFDRPPSQEQPWPAVVTADLVYDANELVFDDVPPHAYLATTMRFPGVRAGRPTRPIFVPAGTVVSLAGHRLFTDMTRYENFAMYTWALPDGQRLSAWPAERDGGSSCLMHLLVPALVVPSWSPLATVEAGTGLVCRAFDLASREWLRQFGTT